jgi:hypothetical protein
MGLPNPGMDFTAFDTLPAASLDDLVENIEALANGSGFSSATSTSTLGGAPTSWTPSSWTNVTLGNAVVSGSYTKVGRKVKGRLSVIVGSTTNVTGQLVFALPVTAMAYPGTANVTRIGGGIIYDVSGGQVYDAALSMASTSTAGVIVKPANGTWVTYINATNTTPVAPATSDEWAWDFEYDAAA